MQRHLCTGNRVAEQHKWANDVCGSKCRYFSRLRRRDPSIGRTVEVSPLGLSAISPRCRCGRCALASKGWREGENVEDVRTVLVIVTTNRV
jgi:hypothetical protein